MEDVAKPLHQKSEINNSVLNFFSKQSLFGVAAIIASLAVAYYYAIFLPNEAKLDRQAQNAKSLIELNERQIKVAGELRSTCIDSGKSVSNDFGIETTSPSPLFFPYDDGYSFNRNERLYTALDAYVSCLKTDPRNDGQNQYIKKFIDDAEWSIFGGETIAGKYIPQGAQGIIRNHLKEVKEKNPEICSNYILTKSAKSFCDGIFIPGINKE